MNRGGNLLNSALLGSSGRTSQVFINAAQTYQVVVTARLYAGRQLRAQSTPSIPATGRLVLAGSLKASTLVSASITSRLAGLTAVSLTASKQVSVSTSGQLQAYRAKKLQSFASIVFVPSATLRRYMAQKLSATQVMDSGITATLKNLHPVSLVSGSLIAVSMTPPELRRYSRLVGSINLQVTLTGSLSASSRIRAPVTRIVYLPVINRVSTILGFP